MKNLIFVAVALLCIQASNCASNCDRQLSKAESKGKKFYTDFKTQHDVARSIVLNDIQPICDAIIAFVSDIQSDKYDGDASGFYSAYQAFFGQFDSTATYAINQFEVLRKDVKKLLKIASKFNDTTQLTCQTGSITDQCEQNLNQLECVEQEFLNGLPAVAQLADDLLDLLIPAGKLLQSFVAKFANPDAESSDATQIDTDKAFIGVFAELHDVIHTWFEQFEELCTNVDSLLTSTITTYFS